MKALSVEFNSNDDGKGLEMDQFVSVLSQVLPGLASEALEAQFMKVDANSDGFVL
jgi:Ca2+-binding EF-hand superfamily protein